MQVRCKGKRGEKEVQRRKGEWGRENMKKAITKKEACRRKKERIKKKQVGK